MEHWRHIPTFSRYSVSDLGRVRNDTTDRIMRLTRNSHGVYQVGLRQGHGQKKRSVPLLVASAFVEKPGFTGREQFNTPIHLDGSRSNNRADNLMWRPHWFAVKYSQQFNGPIIDEMYPIIELKTQERFVNAFSAAISFGLLQMEIIDAIIKRTYVWPTFQEFRFLE